ncbi:MAG: glycoside hydrolase TIM-barrel-like domain-containing protein [Pikeienuella sp.]
MATMVLSAAGSSIGGAMGGSFMGIAASTLGRAAGGVAGAMIDQKLLGQGSRSVPTGRLERIRFQNAGEGEPIPRLFGLMRVGGQVIWASRFAEHVDESREGGKGGGPTRRNYRYSVSFAVALCEGRIQRIGRVWADGTEISLSDYRHRLHRGGENQRPDALIEAIEGAAPAYRGIAYIVFEDMPLAPFGNRVPQLNIEVWREPEAASGDEGPALSELVRAVAMSPGSGEFCLETEKIQRITGPGRTSYENVNTLTERPDMMLGLDQLQDEAPNCKAVSLVVSWFGDDLRCGACDIRPCVETRDKKTSPSRWIVNGIGRGGARVVSSDAEGRPIYGGTPSDGSVVRAIREMKARGLKVMFYPFILMDVPAGNRKPDPWTGAEGQLSFPWRGRITLNRAPGVAGSPDKTPLAAEQVGRFFGDAARAHFAPSGESVSYSGPAEWSFRRFILHYAHLCALAGGVESFCIGSELRGLTRIRSGASTYPAVARLRALAADVRAVLGPDVKIGYAADWSEYFGHQPGDGSGDVFFHLDPLWADDDIDFIGIDNYQPLSDWRYRDGHADEAAKSVYSLPYLDGNVEGGEGYDWYYADAAARNAQERTAIIDTAHGEHWIFRPKDIRNWWSNPHHNRPGGARSGAPTAWTPRSKPIWFTEIGCPAVDLGANQPNVFVDPKSSENALPYFSRGVRDDFMQRRYLQAALSHWGKPANNPVSPVYGGGMIRLDRVFIWTWDARPWPDFPNRLSVWSDGPNHRLGHWITGRLGSASLADVVAEICARAGLRDFDVSELYGVVNGFKIDDAETPRAALQSLMTAFAFDAAASGETLRFRHRDRPLDARLSPADAVLGEAGGAEMSFSRAPEGDVAGSVSFGFIDSERDYELGALEARMAGSRSTRTASSSAPILLDSGAAGSLADRQLAEAEAARETAAFTAARRRLELEPGDIVAIDEAPGDARYRIDAIEDLGARGLALTRIASRAYAAVERPATPRKPSPVFPALPVVARFLDLPLIRGGEMGPGIAAFSRPWAGSASLFVGDEGDDFALAARIARPAVMGALAETLPGAAPALWSRGAGAMVRLFGGGLSAKPERAVLNGANLAAVKSPSGEWEVMQFREAELIGDGLWRLSGLLRGQAGTEPFIGDPTPEGAPFVLLDGAVAEIDVPAAMRGIARDWRIGPGRKPYTHDSYTGFVATDRGVRFRPYAPAHLRAVRDRSGGDVAINWIRRARIDGDGWDGVDPPLGEAREVYRLRIGGARVVDLAVRDWVWTASMQVADGLSGAVEIAVAQISDRFGPGPETRVVIDV